MNNEELQLTGMLAVAFRLAQVASGQSPSPEPELMAIEYAQRMVAALKSRKMMPDNL